MHACFTYGEIWASPLNMLEGGGQFACTAPQYKPASRQTDGDPQDFLRCGRWAGTCMVLEHACLLFCVASWADKVLSKLASCY